MPHLNFIGLIITFYFGMAINSKKIYDLKRRTFLFAKNVMEYIDKLPKKVSGIEIGRQLIRSAGSVGANYIEADEALSRKILSCVLKYVKRR
jgi:four helix bundle protein